MLVIVVSWHIILFLFYIYTKFSKFSVAMMGIILIIIIYKKLRTDQKGISKIKLISWQKLISVEVTLQFTESHYLIIIWLTVQVYTVGILGM